MKEPFLVVHWPKEHYYFDLIPMTTFDQKNDGQDIEHQVVGPRGGIYGTARCKAKVNGRVVELDYLPFRQLNEVRGMDLGALRLQFTDLKLRVPLRALWRKVGGVFKLADATLAIELRDAGKRRVPSIETVFEGSVRGVNYYCRLASTISAGEGPAKECWSRPDRTR
jgi:hypothetical protein